MQSGVVKWYDHKKRFGFIVPDDGGNDVFVHVSSIARIGRDTLEEGQRVEFKLGENNGRSCAVDLKLL